MLNIFSNFAKMLDNFRFRNVHYGVYKLTYLNGEVRNVKVTTIANYKESWRVKGCGNIPVNSKVIMIKKPDWSEFAAIGYLKDDGEFVFNQSYFRKLKSGGLDYAHRVLTALYAINQDGYNNIIVSKQR